MDQDNKGQKQDAVAPQERQSTDEEAERYFLAMTNDCADPDDGTLRTSEQVHEDWKLLGIID